MSISGTLNDMSVYELLQMPVRERKTGTLTIQSQDQRAELTYDQGVLIHAENNELTGEEAVYPILAWDTGTFDLDFHPISKPTNVQLKIENIIMEGVRRLDENKKVREDSGGVNQDIIDEIKKILANTMQEEGRFNFICLIDQRHTKTLVKQENDGFNNNLKQAVAIQLELINQSKMHIEDDPMEFMLTKTKYNLILSHLLDRELVLMVACEEQVPLGQLFLTIRRTVETLNKLLST